MAPPPSTRASRAGRPKGSGDELSGESTTPAAAAGSAAPSSGNTGSGSGGSSDGTRPGIRRVRTNPNASASGNIVMDSSNLGVPRNKSDLRSLRSSGKAKAVGSAMAHDDTDFELDFQTATAPMSGSAQSEPSMTGGRRKFIDDDDDDLESSLTYLPTTADFSLRSSVPQRLLDTSSSDFGSVTDARGKSKTFLGTSSSSAMRQPNKTGATNAMMNLSTNLGQKISDFHQSFVSAMGGSDNSDMMLDDSEAGLHGDPRRVTPQNSAKNVFQAREDLRDVDQSVNLMDAETAKYEESLRGKRNRRSKSSFGGSSSGSPGGKGGSGNQKFRQSMVEIFLGERDNVHGYNGNSRGSHSISKGQLRGSRRNWFVHIFCNIYFFFLVAIVAGVAVLFPVLPVFWKQVSNNNNNNNNNNTSEGNSSVEPTEPPFVPKVVEEEEEEESYTSASPQRPLAEKLVVEERKQVLETILLDVDAYFDMGMASEAALQARDWMVAYDPAQMPLESTSSAAQITKEIVERFVLATLYFATHPSANADTIDLVGGAAPSTTREEEADEGADTNGEDQGRRLRRHDDRSLEAFTPPKNSLSDWMTQENVCSWQGITCRNSDAKLTNIDLSNANLKGTIPPELNLLDGLIELNLSFNEIEGGLPLALKNLKNLESVQLDHNKLSGDVASVFCNLKYEHDLKYMSSDCVWRVACGCCDECF